MNVSRGKKRDLYSQKNRLKFLIFVKYFFTDVVLSI